MLNYKFPQINPKMAFLAISFGLFLLVMVTVTADDADFLDLEDWEAPVNLTNGKVVVDFYTVADQCQPQPGYERVLINQLLFYLPKEGVCRDGFLICYFGQLGKEMPHLGHGLIPAIPYRMGNIRNNEVTKRCDKLRTQALLECGEDTGNCMYAADAPGGKNMNSSWHGMLLRTDEDGNIIVQLSTSKESFIVPRNEFSEWLSLKLASFKDKVSFFSRDTGPKRSFIDRKDGAGLEECRNQIHLKNDAELWKEYAKQRRKGAFLKKYAGIWSLGLDMLPTEAQDDEDEFWLYIQSPECCELKAWFLTPSAVKPEVAKKETIRKIYVSGVKINDSFKLEFEGRMDANAKGMEIIFEAKYNRSADFLQGFNWTVDVAQQKAAFIIKEKLSIQKESETLSTLAPGMLFHMNITFYTDQVVLEVNANCSSSTFNLTLEKPINFEDYFDFKMHGDIVLYSELPTFKCEPETTTTPSPSTSTTTTPTTTTTMTTTTIVTTTTTGPPFEPFSFTMSKGEGLLVRGKIPETNMNGFSLVFKREIPKDSSYVIALYMEVLLQVDRIILSKEELCFTREPGCVNGKRNNSDVLALEKFPKPGDNFEIFFFCDFYIQRIELVEKYMLDLHIWVQNVAKRWNFNYDYFLADEQAHKDNKLNFIFKVTNGIAIVETPIVQPNVGISEITDSGLLNGLSYQKSIDMAQATNRKALEIRAKQFGHGLQGYTEKFAFYFTYTDNRETLNTYFNGWKIVPAGISVQFDEAGNGKMWLEYQKIGGSPYREEVSSPEVRIHLNEDFTIRFGIRGGNWFDVWVNGKWIKSVEVNHVSELRTLYVVSIVTKQDGTVVQQFPHKKELGMIYRGGLALLAEPDFN